ncbi:MAG TPA: hypothetical protein VIC59_02560 [Gemmatimonadota bacterium]|jgi:hypothetical protein
MRLVIHCCALLAGALLLGACGGGDGSTGNECFLDEGVFRNIEVRPGTPPSFTWCGAPAMTLDVRPAAGGSSAWTIECNDDVFPLCIDPPVAYGDSVETTDLLAGPAPLQSGASYQLCLSGVDGRPATACVPFTQ